MLPLLGPSFIGSLRVSKVHKFPWEKWQTDTTGGGDCDDVQKRPFKFYGTSGYVICERPSQGTAKMVAHPNYVLTSFLLARGTCCSNGHVVGT